MASTRGTNSHLTNFFIVLVFLSLDSDHTFIDRSFFNVSYIALGIAQQWKFLAIPIFTVLLLEFNLAGISSDFLVSYPIQLRKQPFLQSLDRKFGPGKEFMPSLDEGSFLLMPTSMPHAGIEQNQQYVEHWIKGYLPFLRWNSSG